MIVVAGWHYFWCRQMEAVYTKLFGAALALASASAFMSLALGSVEVGTRSFRAGGYVGEFVAGRLSEYLSRTGSVIVILALVLVAVILSTQFSFGRLFSAIYHVIVRGLRSGMALVRQWIDERRKAQQRRDVIAKHVKKGTAPEVVKAAVERARTETPRARPAKPVVAEDDDDDEEAALGRPAVRSTPPVVQKRPRVPLAPPLPLPAPEPVSRGPAERRLSGYTLPPLALLDPPKAERKVDERELMESARLLEEKCREFAVEGAVVQIHPGPVVTTFEFKPDAGVKYSRVTGLADDLCLAMQAESVLIERIPGKSTVGIQIPNPNREPISLRELLESDTYQRSASKVTLALGKTIHGEPLRRGPRHDASPAHRGLDRHRKIGRAQRDADEHPVPRDAR